jgi:predicted GNAT family N-acyltransferase
MRRHVAGVFVAYEAESTTVAGYYTLSATSIELADLLQDMAKRLPRRPTLPAVLLGRLAVDQRYRGQRVGELLLMSALRRSARLRTDIGMIAVIVDAKDDRARSFYERYGFMRLEEQEFRLFLPMKTIDQLFVD